MTTRKVIKIIAGKAQVDGAGVNLIRVIGRDHAQDFDPFLMLDVIDSRNPKDYIKGFPWHPHRGIETVTYVIKGSLEHGDSLGNRATINADECYWLTAGSGILHQEMPQTSEHMLGFQLWLNLPQKDKMTTPKHFSVRTDAVKIMQEDNCTVKIISGEYKGNKGARGEYVDAQLLDVRVNPNETFRLATDKNSTLFIYIIEGAGLFGDSHQTIVTERNAALFDNGDELFVKTGDSGLHFAIFSGRPLKEPIAWSGPIVMNSRHDLLQAFQDLNTGTFIKQKGSVIEGEVNHLFLPPLSLQNKL